MKTKRLIYLDCIRALAIILIILAHFNEHMRGIVSKELVFFNPNIASGIGVSLFIILSGASLMLSSEKNYTIPNFYKKRFFAIFPLFYVTYFCYFFLIVVVFNNRFEDRNPLSFIFTILGLDGFLLYKIKTYNLIGEWFLGFIIILYLFFPVIRYLFKISKTGTLAMSFCVSFLTYHFYTLDMYVLRFPPIRLFEFVLGMVFITSYRDISDKANKVLLALSLVTLAMIFIVKGQSYLLVSKILLGVISFCLIASASHLITNNRIREFVIFFSRYSYGAFLFHHIFIIKFISLNKQYISSLGISIVMFLVSLLIVYCASYSLTNFTNYCLKQLMPQNTNLII